MIIFIDGWQGSGKTTLIENCKYKHGRFPFNQYLNKFDLDINDLQITKDLAILFTSQFIKDNVILDRGPFSTIYYSLKEDRYGKDTPLQMMKFMKELREYNNCQFVWIFKTNDNSLQPRKHNDGFDYLNDDEDPNKEKLLQSIFDTAQNLGIMIHTFEVDFSLKEKDNVKRFNDFLEGIIYEYNRNKN